MNLPDYTFVRMPVPKDPTETRIACDYCACTIFSFQVRIGCSALGIDVTEHFHDSTAPDECPFIIATKEDEHDR